MAKKKTKKQVEQSKNNPFLDAAVIRDDTLTIEDVKKFIAKGKKGSRADFVNIADRSWAEIKKRNKRGGLYGGNDLDRARRWVKFPLWWSCLCIRSPIVFSRLPAPLLKDTQGDDPYGRTACVLGERFVASILKTFDAFEEFNASVTDFLVTDFGLGRGFYRKKDVIEEEKIRLQEIQPSAPPPAAPSGQAPDSEGGEAQGQPDEMTEPMPPMFITPDGEIVDNPMFDDLGPYMLTGESINVESEEVYFESHLYCGFYTDDVNRWSKVTRIAFEYQYSYREFIEKFGREAADKIAQGDLEDHKDGKPITCYEYHDKFLKEVRWFADNSEDFFQPKYMATEDGTVDNSDIYGLANFFPCTQPLMINCPTDDFWPVPEYFQVADILDDIHNIVSRMFLLTKAIRVRFFFDSSVPQLTQLAGETGEGGGLGIPNLEASIMNGKGDLRALVAYFPVDEMIQGLNNMYTAFEQRLSMFYQITGLSDLVRGQTADGDKTYGERQLEGKFALNRIEPRQRMVQEWVKDNYQLLMEMGLKLFSDQTIDEYITPQTLDQEDRERYVGALELLKSNRRGRFRIDFETDSTFAINEEWKKKQAIELANTLTKALESTAKVAETQPELAKTELTVLKHLIGEFSDGKLFIDEIQTSIQEVIDKAMQPKDEGPNIDMMKLQLEGQRLQMDGQKHSAQMQLEQLKLQSAQQIEIARIERDDRIASIESQIEQYKISGEQQLEQMKVAADSEKAAAILDKEYQKISSDIVLAQQEMQLKRDELMVELRKIADKKEVDQFALMIDERVAGFEAQLKTAQLELDKTTQALALKERYMTEQRLQTEDAIKQNTHHLDLIHSALDLALKKKELEAPVISAPTPSESAPKAKRKMKVVRDKSGNIAGIEDL